MKPTIIDNLSTKSTKQPNPIKLVSCLQCHLNENGESHFLETDLNVSPYSKVVRVAKVALCNGGFDVIACYLADNVEFCALFLGHWNDGVVA
jgi:hypothetical protein